MNTMNMPGFFAEASLLKGDRYYRIAATPGRAGEAIQPAQEANPCDVNYGIQISECIRDNPQGPLRDICLNYAYAAFVFCRVEQQLEMSAS